jgi:phosphatidylethanolamine/phosphatidyl-N-methylethanolamine N-methyltransferase
VRDHLTFFQQFRQRFKTTGAITPSSRFLASAMTGPMKKMLARSDESPKRILEIGPGTGAVTRSIVKLLRPEDRFDLVELNETFAGLLKERFHTHPHYKKVSGQSEVHMLPLQEFAVDAPYDFIVSGLPLNNFSCEMVQEIFECYFRLLAPGGTLSYFEYMYVRSIRKHIGPAEEKQRMRSLDEIICPYLEQHRIRQSWVLINLPPAWVQHLQAAGQPAPVS